MSVRRIPSRETHLEGALVFYEGLTNSIRPFSEPPPLPDRA